MSEDEQTGLVNTDLHIVVLVKGVIHAVLHDARVSFCEIVLILIVWASCWRFRCFPARATPFALGFFFPLPHFGVVFCLFSLVAFLCPRFQDSFGSRQVFQPTLPSCDFILNDQSFRQDSLTLFRASSHCQYSSYLTAQPSCHFHTLV